MKSFLFLAATLVALSIVACSKKTEKCSYNNVEMSCEEYRRLTQPKPKPTPVDEDIIANKAQSPSSDPVEDCNKAVTEIVKDEKVLAICPNANPETSSCVTQAWVAYLTSDEIVKVCENATADTDECIIEGQKNNQSTAVIAENCSKQ